MFFCPVSDPCQIIQFFLISVLVLNYSEFYHLSLLEQYGYSDSKKGDEKLLFKTLKKLFIKSLLSFKKL